MFLDLFSGGQADGDANKSLFTTLKDAFGNYITKSNRQKLPANQGGLLLMGKNDDVATFMRTDRKGNQMIGNFNPELIEVFEGATLNVQKWTAAATSFTGAQATLVGYNFNNAGIAGTAVAVASLISQRLFQRIMRVPLQLKIRLRHALVSGSNADFGFGVPSGTTVIVPNGVSFRIASSGVVTGVVTYNGAEIAVAAIKSQVDTNGNTIDGDLNMSDAYYTANYFTYDIVIDDDNALFTVQDTSTGDIIGLLSLPLPVAFQKMWGATALPVFKRLYNQSIPASVPVFIATELQVLSTDWRINPTMDELAGSLGLSGGRNPFTGAPTENHTNSAAPASATLSNTAAGYTTEGGKFQFAAVAGAETDYALFGLQIPAGGRYLCKGFKIDIFNMGAVSAGTPTLLEFAAGFNSSAVSLATANIVRKQLGAISVPVGAVVGQYIGTIDINFEVPQVVESGRFLHLILKVPVGTATASQIIRGTAHIRGRYI